MIRAPRQSPAALRHVFLTLAALAIALKVLIPPGFMAAPAVNDGGFPIVLCTSLGPTTILPGEPLPGHRAPGEAPDTASHDAPCLFAGHGLGAPAPELAHAGDVRFAAYSPVLPEAPEGLAPGRGLPGPPLPARGPPSLPS